MFGAAGIRHHAEGAELVAAFLHGEKGADARGRRRGQGVAVPFDVWKYTRGSKMRKYCFVDLTGFGNYVLVYSNDPAEPSRPDWWLLMGDEYADEVRRF